MKRQGACPPYIMLDAQKYVNDRDYDPGDTFDVDQVGTYSGTYVRLSDGRNDGHVMEIHRKFRFEIGDNGLINFVKSGIVVTEDRTTRKPQNVTRMSCGHPVGCGEPCGWCEHKRIILQVHAAATSGDVELTMTMLEKALETGYEDRAALATNPYYSSLRGDPRFEDLLTSQD